MTATIAPAGLPSLRPLLGELNDLKRVRVAGRAGSLASIGFVRSWWALVSGDSPAAVAARELARAVAGARLGGIDAATLAEAGLAPDEARSVLAAAIEAAGSGLPGEVIGPIRSGLASGRPDPDSPWTVPTFVVKLAAQPRAGATRPGRPRLILEPPEDHAEHCYLTAIYGALVAPLFGAEAGAPFLAGLAHHFHNAYLPDSGFAGEELLGDHLGPIMARLTARALAELPPGLAGEVTAAREILDHADSPEARSFHAADVLDRVLQMEQYAKVAAFETRQALDDLELVHAGPLQAYQNAILVAAGLLP